jgi:hypothetical protein
MTITSKGASWRRTLQSALEVKGQDKGRRMKERGGMDERW